MSKVAEKDASFGRAPAVRGYIPQVLGTVPGTSKSQYGIPQVGVIHFNPYNGPDRFSINWAATLARLEKSDVPAYRIFHAQVLQFFEEIKTNFKGEMPTELLVRVPYVGKVFSSNLGKFYKIRYEGKNCIIPKCLIIGDWKRCRPGEPIVNRVRPL